MSEQAVNFRFGGNSDDLEKMFKRAEGGFEHLESLAGAVESAFAFEKIKSAFESFIEESDKAEVSSMKLRSTMTASGMGGDPKEIEEMGEALEQLTTFQADATVEAGAMLSRFHLTQDQIVTMLPAVQDLAAFMGGDLASAADSVGRATQVGSMGLRALNLGFTSNQRAAFDAADANGRLSMIMAKINSTAPGFAQAMAQTAGGAAKQLGNQFDQLKQSIGAALEKPIVVVMHAAADAVHTATNAFEQMNPILRGTIVAMGVGTGGVAALGAAFAGAVNAIKLLSPLFGPLITGFASTMNAERSLASTTTALKASFASMRVTAITAWGGIIVPIAAVAGAIVGVIAIVGVMSNVWENNIGNIQQKVAQLKQTFSDLGDWVKSLFSGLVANVVTAVAYMTNRVKGMNEQTAGIAAVKTGQEASASVDKAFGAVAEGLSIAIDSGAIALKYAGQSLRDNLLTGAHALGLDKLAGMFDQTKGDKGGKIADTGGKKDTDAAPLTLKTVFLGMTEKATKQLDEAMAAELVRVLGGGSLKKTAAMLDKLETTSGLSESTLTTILQKTTTGAAGLAGVAAALKGTSDATITALLKASGDNIDAVVATAPAIKGMSDGAVAAILQTGASLQDLKRIAPALVDTSEGVVKAILDTGDGIEALRELGPHVKTMSDDVVKALIKASGDTTGQLGGITGSVRALSDDTITSFLKMGGTVQGLQSLGDSMQVSQKAAADAFDAADAYWHTLKGTLESHGTDMAAGLAQGMGQVGGAFTNALGALQHGDVWGAAIGGMTSVITESKSFQAVSKIINEMFTNFAQALNPLFDGLGPILQMVGTLLAAIGGAIKTIMQGIQPIFAVISAVLKPIFTILTGVFGVLSKTFKDLFSPLGSIIKGLMPIFKVISDLFSVMVPILMKLFTATNPLNIILSAVAALFKLLLPVFNLLSTAIGKFMNFVVSIFKALAGFYNSVLGFVAKLVQDLISKIPGMGDTAKKWADGIRASMVNLGQFDDAMKQITQDSTTQSDTTLPDLSAALDDTAASAQGASQEIGNAPQGFKVALDEFNATQALSTAAVQNFIAGLTKAQSSGSTTQVVAGSLPGMSNTGAGSAPGNTTTVNINVTNPDPATLAKTVSDQINKNNLQATGTPVNTLRPLKFGGSLTTSALR